MRKRVLLSFDCGGENLLDDVAELDLMPEVKGRLKA